MEETTGGTGPLARSEAELEAERPGLLKRYRTATKGGMPGAGAMEALLVAAGLACYDDLDEDAVPLPLKIEPGRLDELERLLGLVELVMDIAGTDEILERAYAGGATVGAAALVVVWASRSVWNFIFTSDVAAALEAMGYMAERRPKPEDPLLYEQRYLSPGASRGRGWSAEEVREWFAYRGVIDYRALFHWLDIPAEWRRANEKTVELASELLARHERALADAEREARAWWACRQAAEGRLTCPVCGADYAEASAKAFDASRGGLLAEPWESPHMPGSEEALLFEERARERVKRHPGLDSRFLELLRLLGDRPGLGPLAELLDEWGLMDARYEELLFVCRLYLGEEGLCQLERLMGCLEALAAGTPVEDVMISALEAGEPAEGAVRLGEWAARWVERVGEDDVVDGLLSMGYDQLAKRVVKGDTKTETLYLPKGWMDYGQAARVKVILGRLRQKGVETFKDLERFIEDWRALPRAKRLSTKVTKAAESMLERREARLGERAARVRGEGVRRLALDGRLVCPACGANIIAAEAEHGDIAF